DGIIRHRRVDAFTDSHPSVAAFRRVLFPELGHNARVVSDVFYDHFLACDFERWSGGTTLDDFVAGVYTVLDDHAHVLPGRLALVYPFMRRDDWLRSYRNVEGIYTALFHLSKRLSRRPHLEQATHFLTDRRGELGARFEELFVDLVAYIRPQDDAQFTENTLDISPSPSPSSSRQ
ncbi:MAG TPA: acyl carrier protein phosphodiesterase, partial [Thermoanaerobaculia bacterium]|nr:acyl carrier protein phosphodiesterase [Thermoanaerobaculia bacterium]